MQAIKTTYINPARSYSKIKASCDAGQITIPFNHELDSDHNHKAACEALIKKLNWYGLGDLHGGSFGNDMYWVIENRVSTLVVKAKIKPE